MLLMSTSSLSSSSLPLLGGKMELQALKLYLMSIYGLERVDALFWEMQLIMLRSLLAVQPSMITDKHTFELYGKLKVGGWVGID